jgi:hypothetical protein
MERAMQICDKTTEQRLGIQLVLIYELFGVRAKISLQKAAQMALLRGEVLFKGFSISLATRSFQRRHAMTERVNAKGAFVSESALHNFDGDKPNSVGSPWRPDDHSSHPDFSECPANFHPP